MVKLSVNINKVATLRNARGGNVPDVVAVAQDIERFGADGITVHPRPDERHIRAADVYALREVLTTELNVEGYPDDRFMKMVLEVRPAQATLVPDPPGVLTSNAGWDTIKHQDFLLSVVDKLKSNGIRTSIFAAPDEKMIESAKSTGTDRVELYTEHYASHYGIDPGEAIRDYQKAARMASACGLGVNAGHDLSLQNLNYFAQNISGLLEVSIGHALISDALYFGLENTVKMYRHQLNRN